MSQPPGIEPAAQRSPLLRDALAMARRAHSGQVRTGSGGLAYIEHPIAVAEELMRLECSDEVVAAALLHDVVEDSEASVADVRDLAGERVAELVGTLSDDPSIEDRVERKREHRERVACADSEALAIYAADKLTNIRMLCDAWEQEGERAAEELRAPLEEKIGSWRSDLEMLREQARPGSAAAELSDRLEEQLRRLDDCRATTTSLRRPAG
jgi:(p)ppGpp synthase/HD superfamily hydrolase